MVKIFQGNYQTIMLRVSKKTFVNYCYLIIDKATHDAIIIDPAWEVDVIEATLQNHAARLTGIFLTHHHYDHVNLANLLSAKYDIAVYIAKPEIETYRLNLNKIQLFDPDQDILLNKILVTAIYTPGHTLGSTCYRVGDSLFTGDTLFIEGCGGCTGPGADPYAMSDSLHKLKLMIAPNTRIFPGHRYLAEPGMHFSEVCKNNIYLNIEDKEQFVRFRMRTNQVRSPLDFF